jgi:hypothetical protein
LDTQIQGTKPHTLRAFSANRHTFSANRHTLSTVSNKDSECATLGVFLSLGTFDTGAISSSGRSNPRIVCQSCGEGGPCGFSRSNAKTQRVSSRAREPPKRISCPQTGSEGTR